MNSQIQKEKKMGKPIVLTVCLIVATIIVFLISRTFPNMELWISIVLLSIIDIGFIISLILGVRTKKTSVVWFSILANGVFFILLTILIFLLAVANGISEP
ncbi:MULTISPECIES: hypothetical protein [Priestia]|uniref:hypothetical protein n=1 Tax=Priestia TaxID=2800373 RepID=UPI0021D656ED|nr:MULTISPECIES: hypothetical protein [Priestia]MCU7712969.1 hypothetical protein [Priestia megaterium]MCW1049030.1 hypothetical protein [Priestia sp. JV24]MDN4634032.1 hypothetical protein [Sphingomonas sp. PsM26]